MELELKQVSKSYGSFQALKPADLILKPGIYALLGPNGAGKSTLMNLITQSLVPTSGKIQLDGQDVFEMGDKYRDILGYVPQQQGLYESMSASRFLAYMASLKGIKPKEAKEKIGRVLELVNLSHKADSKISSFSGGMKQRLLIAQALLNDPKILVLDEPTAGLDPVERANIRNIISQLSKDKIILFATHVVSDIEQSADWVLLMKQGTFAAFDSPAKLCSLLEGKVFELSIPVEMLEAFQSHLHVVKVVSSPEGYQIRYIADQPLPLKEARMAVPTLEDVYLYTFEHERKQSGINKNGTNVNRNPEDPIPTQVNAERETIRSGDGP